MDVFGFRIVVDQADDCYRTLGVVHNLYKPVAGRFKDYIAIPKANGYQSLHTTLFGMHGVPIEVQIRTEQMDAVAETALPATGCTMPETTISSPASAAPGNGSGPAGSAAQAGNPLEFIESLKTRPVSRMKSTCSPRRGHHGAAQGRLPRRLCLCGAHRHRQRLRGLSCRPASGALVTTAAERPERRNHHLRGCPVKPGLADLRGLRKARSAFARR